MTLKEAALEYFDRGWTPIPLRYTGSVEDRKKPLLERWRQYQHVRPERDDVDAWWNEHPSANIALLCGRTSGLVVVDFDGPVDDPVSFLDRHGIQSDAPLVSTGKGFHLYFSHPGGDIPNGVRLARIEEVAVDVRGDGGYVVAPPSIHGSGRVYQWTHHPTGRPPMLPDNLRGLIFRQPDAALKPPTSASDIIRSTGEIDRLLSGVGSGERNHAAAKVAGYFLKVTHGDESAAWQSLCLWNKQNRPPLGEVELRQTFQSIARREAAKPKSEKEEAEGGNLPTLLDGRAWADAVRYIPPRKGVPAPSLPTLHEVGGIVPKDLLILAGRPGMGKSTAAWGVAVDCGLEQRLPTIIFSTEMTMADVARWIASKRHKTMVAQLTDEEWEETLQVLSHSPLMMCDKGSITVEDICAIVKSRPETKLVIVDHIQRIGGGGNENRNQQLESIAKELKSLAKDHDCTVMVLSQMSRVSARAKQQPQLYDLRDSGGLEQEADAVIFLWSDAEDPTANPLEVKFYLAKNRHGALAEVPCTFYKHLKYFRPVELKHQLAWMDAQQRANAQKEQARVLLEGQSHVRAAEPERDAEGIDAALALFPE